jgi:serine O-acetyltransferase
MQLKYLKYDLYRYFYPNDQVSKIGILGKLKIILSTQGVWAIVVYRLRRQVIFECKSKIVRRLLKPPLFVLQLMVEMTTGIHVQPTIDIGPGFYIGHFGTIFLGGHTRVGKFFNISQGCTVGYAGRGEKLGLPEIGDFVYLAPGAKVIGKIRIGNHAAVGANAVVTKDVPEGAVVGGIPAKVINYGSSRDFVQFNLERCREIV